jgi:hypothetical protein
LSKDEARRIVANIAKLPERRCHVLMQSKSYAAVVAETRIRGRSLSFHALVFGTRLSVKEVKALLQSITASIVPIST